MKYINNVGYLNENTYQALGSAKQSTSNDFDSLFKAEAVVYATPESTTAQANNNTGSTENVSSPAELESIFNKAAKEYNIDVNLLKAVAKTESNFNPKATSSVGAMGVMQLMPDTAASLGVTDAYDPEQNIMGGAKYLSQMLKKYNGNVSLALAAYNAGPGNVDKYGGIPPFEETQNYVKKILDYLGKGNITYPVSNTSNDTTTVNATASTNNSDNNTSDGDVTYVSATADSTLSTSQSDITTIYAVAASDVTNPAKLNL